MNDVRQGVSPRERLGRELGQRFSDNLLITAEEREHNAFYGQCPTAMYAPPGGIWEVATAGTVQ
jgi:hypothetical protein